MTQDNRYIKFVQEEHRHFTNPPPVKRQSFGFSGWLGLIVIALVILWFWPAMAQNVTVTVCPPVQEPHKWYECMYSAGADKPMRWRLVRTYAKVYSEETACLLDLDQASRTSPSGTRFKCERND